MFNYQKYIDDSPSDSRPFFKAFLKLQMFTRLLERKLWPAKDVDMVDLMYFEESIRLKFNRYSKNSKK
jgi:hypothetical protein